MYIIVVFIAVISTVVGFAFSGVARFGKYYRPQGKKQLAHPVRDAAFVLVLLTRDLVLSQVGIMNLVKYGYSLLGYINLFVIILPALILGGRKISKKYLKSTTSTPRVSTDNTIHRGPAFGRSFFSIGELYYQVQHFKGIKEFIQSPKW